MLSATVQREDRNRDGIAPPFGSDHPASRITLFAIGGRLTKARSQFGYDLEQYRMRHSFP